jgi:hypothetical protein
MFSIESAKVKQIIVLIIVLITGLAFFVSAGLTDEIQWAEILAGFAGGLSVWVCTYVVVNWIDPSFKVHHKTTTKIYNLITGEYLSLEDDRRKAKGSEFYSNFYTLADKIKISGISLNAFTSYLIDSKERDSNKHLLNIMKKNKVQLEVIFNHPNCDVITEKDFSDEYNRTTFHKENVIRSIRNLKTLCDEFKGNKISLHPKSKIIARLTKQPLNTTLFYAGYNSNSKIVGENDFKDIVLMGMLYNHKEGTDSQLFRLPNRGNSHEADSFRQDLLEHFDRTFSVCKKNQVLYLDGDNTREFNDLGTFELSKTTKEQTYRNT